MKTTRYMAIILTAVLALSSCTQFEERFTEIRNQLDSLVDESIRPLSEQVAQMNVTVENSEETRQALEDYINQLSSSLSELESKKNSINEAIDALDADIDSQISAMESDIRAQLEEHRTAMESTIESLKTQLQALQEADEALAQRISDMKEYMNTSVSDAKSWTSATYATLEEYNKTADEMAKVNQTVSSVNRMVNDLSSKLSEAVNRTIPDAIASTETTLKNEINQLVRDMDSAVANFKQEVTGAYEQALKNAVETSTESMKTWINNQLTSYSDIAEVEQMILAYKGTFNTQLASQRAYLTTAIDSLASRLDSLVDANNSDLKDLKERMEDVDDFEKGVARTLIDLAEQITQNARDIAANAAEITEVDTTISTLSPKVTELETLASEQNELASEMQGKLSELNPYRFEAWLLTSAAKIAENTTAIANASQTIADNASALADNVAAIKQNTEDISALRDSIDARKLQIQEEYTSAIAQAIEEADGAVGGEIADRIAELNDEIDEFTASFNERVDSINARIGRIDTAITDLNQRFADIQQSILDARAEVDNLLSRIQSMTWMPDAGSCSVVTYTTGRYHTATAAVRYKVLPTGTAEKLAEHPETISAAYVGTITKAQREIPARVRSVSADGDVLTIVTDASVLPLSFFGGSTGASVSVIVSDGNNAFQSSYAPLHCLEQDEELDIPDEAFRSYLLDEFDMNEDGVMTLQDSVLFAAAYLSGAAFDLHDMEINDLSGLSYFPAVNKLSLAPNQLNSFASIGAVDTVKLIVSEEMDVLLNSSFGASVIDLTGTSVGDVYVPVDCKFSSVVLDYGTYFYTGVPAACTSIDSLALMTVDLPEEMMQIYQEAYEEWGGTYGELAGYTDVTGITGSPTAGLASLDLLKYFKTLTSLPDSWQFNNNTLTEVTFPSSLEEIQAYAFYDCSISVLDIPSKVSAIGRGAFQGCPVKVVRFRSATPPSVGEEPFSEDCEIERMIVPIGCSAAYAALFPDLADVIEEASTFTINTAE